MRWRQCARSSRVRVLAPEVNVPHSRVRSPDWIKRAGQLEVKGGALDVKVEKVDLLAESARYFAATALIVILTNSKILEPLAQTLPFFRHPASGRVRETRSDEQHAF